MATATIQIVVRRGTLLAWTTEDPVLLNGEIGYAEDGASFVIGDGVKTFSQLYDLDPLTTSVNRFISEQQIVQNYLNPLSGGLVTLINNEANSRVAGDNNLQSQINTITGTSLVAINVELDAVGAALVQEIIDRIAGDADLQAQFDAAFAEFKANQGNLHTHWFSGEALDAATPVVLLDDLFLYQYDPTNPAHDGRLLGITEMAVGISEEVKVFSAGFAVFPDPVVFATGGVLYLDPVTGAITDTEPTTAPKIRLGFTTAGANFIFLNIDEGPTWDYLVEKPTEFPPEAHVHTIGDIVDYGNADDLTSGTVPLARIGTNTPDASLVLHGNNTWKNKFEQTIYWEWFNEMCINTATSTNEIIVASVATVGIYGATADSLGISQLQTNAGAAAHICYRLNNTGLYLNSVNVAYFKTRLQISTLSDGTETFNLKIGFTNSGNATSVGADGALFRYTHSVNGGRWQCVNRKANVESAPADSGITVAINTWYVLEIRMTTTSVLYYIDGALVATVAVDVPLAALGAMLGIQKSAGTNSRNLRIDYYYVKIPTGR